MTITARLADLPDINRLDVPDATGASGTPLLLACDLIDEDPLQPRREFDEAALRELAATIAERGVRQPVSVRQHPDIDGRWLLNFGARRLRASRLAGRARIPAFVDEAVDSFDQVIENEQRDGLTPMELALFVKRQIDAGLSQAEIARRLGKSRQYVTMAMALVDPPDWLAQAYREGRCRGLKELHDLRALAVEHEPVVPWVASQACVTRAKVVALRAGLERAKTSPKAGQRSMAVGDGCSRTVAMLHARLDGTMVRVEVQRIPKQPGQVFVTDLASKQTSMVDACRVKLLGFIAE